MRRREATVVALCLALAFAARAEATENDVATPAEARGEIVVSIRGGLLTAPASSYHADAEAFGFTGLGSAGGVTAHAGYEVRDRVVVGLTYSHFAARSTRRLSTLRLETSALLGTLTYTLARARWGQHLGWRLLLDVGVAAGLYFIDERFDSRTRSVQGYGARASLDVGIFYRAVGFTIAWAYHGSQATLNDLIGGKMDAAGFEVSAGLTLRL